METLSLVTVIVLVIRLKRFCSGDILINEINADNPLLDSEEFVELWNPDNCLRSLNGYTLVFFNGVREPVTAYTAVDLSGHCIPPNGFIVIGSSSVNPTPDFVVLDTDAVQNGRGEADAVALYNNNFVPTTITDLHLVDLVIYDKDESTSIANYPANLIYQQTPVHENEGYLPEDESISRCDLPPFSHTSFRVGRITPGAPNFCQPSGSGKEDCYDASIRTTVKFTIRWNSKVNSPHFRSQTTRSSNECAALCSQILACAFFSFNVRNTSSENCFFFFSCGSDMIMDIDWHVGMRLW